MSLFILQFIKLLSLVKSTIILLLFLTFISTLTTNNVSGMSIITTTNNNNNNNNIILNGRVGGGIKSHLRNNKRYEYINRLLKDEQRLFIDDIYLGKHKRRKRDTMQKTTTTSTTVATTNDYNKNINITTRQQNNDNNKTVEISSKLINLSYKMLNNIKLSDLSVYGDKSINLSDISVLDISNNNLFITNIIFNQLYNLQWLDLSNNNLTKFTIKNLNELIYLNLSNNNLITINCELIKSVKFLDLSCNKLNKSLNMNVLYKLETLDLSYNSINIIEEKFFINLKKLKILNFSGNNIKQLLNNNFLYLENVEQIILTNNNISLIENKTFSFMDKLEYLDLSYNNITVTSIRALQGIPDLIGLSVAYNPYLGNALQGFVASWSLKILDARGTGLCQIPTALAQSVRVLKLSDNFFHIIRCGDLDSYPLLQKLYLSTCHIYDIEDDALGRFEILISLHLDGNYLTRIPSSLPSNLESLFLQNNLITDIQSSVFTQLVNLKTLDLSGNKLTYLPELPLPKLITLNIKSSGVRGLSQALVKTSPHLRILQLDNNPIKCADLLGIAEWATPCQEEKFYELTNSDLVEENNKNEEDVFNYFAKVNSHCCCKRMNKDEKNKRESLKVPSCINNKLISADNFIQTQPETINKKNTLENFDKVNKEYFNSNQFHALNQHKLNNTKLASSVSSGDNINNVSDNSSSSSISTLNDKGRELQDISLSFGKMLTPDKISVQVENKQRRIEQAQRKHKNDEIFITENETVNVIKAEIKTKLNTNISDVTVVPNDKKMNIPDILIAKATNSSNMKTNENAKNTILSLASNFSIGETRVTATPIKSEAEEHRIRKTVIDENKQKTSEMLPILQKYFINNTTDIIKTSDFNKVENQTANAIKTNNVHYVYLNVSENRNNTNILPLTTRNAYTEDAIINLVDKKGEQKTVKINTKHQLEHDDAKESKINVQRLNTTQIDKLHNLPVSLAEKMVQQDVKGDLNENDRMNALSSITGLTKVSVQDAKSREQDTSDSELDAEHSNKNISINQYTKTNNTMTNLKQIDDSIDNDNKGNTPFNKNNNSNQYKMQTSTTRTPLDYKSVTELSPATQKHIKLIKSNNNQHKFKQLTDNKKINHKFFIKDSAQILSDDNVDYDDVQMIKMREEIKLNDNHSTTTITTTIDIKNNSNKIIESLFASQTKFLDKGKSNCDNDCIKDNYVKHEENINDRQAKASVINSSNDNIITKSPSMEYSTYKPIIKIIHENKTNNISKMLLSSSEILSVQLNDDYNENNQPKHQIANTTNDKSKNVIMKIDSIVHEIKEQSNLSSVAENNENQNIGNNLNLLLPRNYVEVLIKPQRSSVVVMENQNTTNVANNISSNSSGPAERWNDVRSSENHPGWFVIIGATIGVILSLGLVYLYNCKRAWHRSHRRRRRHHQEDEHYTPVHRDLLPMEIINSTVSPSTEGGLQIERW